jgi:circadian clock protein KaiC
MSDGLGPIQERLATGLPGLDRILHGGLLQGGAYLVHGAPDMGKTVLANQMCFHQPDPAVAAALGVPCSAA